MSDPVSMPVPAGGTEAMAPAMALALEASFGSVEAWRDQVAACGTGPAGLALRPHEGRLVVQAAAGDVPLLVLDAPADVSIAAVDWAAVYARYQHAVHAASEAFGADADSAPGAMLLDVRRAGVFDAAPTMIPGAVWHDPAAVAQWAPSLPAGSELLVYCVYGHEVSHAACLRLRAAGFNAHFLRGGIDGWQAAGRPLADKPAD